MLVFIPKFKWKTLDNIIMYEFHLPVTMLHFETLSESAVAVDKNLYKRLLQKIKPLHGLNFVETVKDIITKLIKLIVNKN